MGPLEKGCTGGYGEGVLYLGARAAPALRGSAAPGLGSAGRVPRSPVPGRVRPGISGGSGGRVPGREAEAGPWRSAGA